MHYIFVDTQWFCRVGLEINFATPEKSDLSDMLMASLLLAWIVVLAWAIAESAQLRLKKDLGWEWRLVMIGSVSGLLEV